MMNCLKKRTKFEDMIPCNGFQTLSNISDSAQDIRANHDILQKFYCNEIMVLPTDSENLN